MWVCVYKFTSWFWSLYSNKYNVPETGKLLMKEKNKIRGLARQDIKTYEAQSLRKCGIGARLDKWSPDQNRVWKYIYAPFMTRVTLLSSEQWGRMFLSVNSPLEIDIDIIYVDLSLQTLHTKPPFRWTAGLNVKGKTTKHIRWYRRLPSLSWGRQKFLIQDTKNIKSKVKSW